MNHLGHEAASHLWTKTTEEMVDGKIRCAVVGAGPVGALAALYAARRGYEVDVYELRGGESMLRR